MTKQSLFQSYVSGITDRTQGERYRTIISYFLPELITAFLLSSILSCTNAYFIANLKSTSLYATQGVTSIFLHLIDKIAEGLCVGAVILCGHFNGLKRFTDAGRAAMTTILVTIAIGSIIAVSLYVGAPQIYNFLQVPESMVAPGIAYLRLKSIAIFLLFIHFGLIGFLRGIKNTRVPMLSFLIGGIVFIFFDYALIFGNFGFPQLGLYGAAIASILQAITMLLVAGSYLMFNRHIRHYNLTFAHSFSSSNVRNLLELSWPVMIDKAVLAAAKIWLVRLIAPMGEIPIASFNVIRDMEQFAFVPAIAFAQVITFLVSNDYGAGNWGGIKNNIKKVIFLASIAVSSILIIFSLFPQKVIHLFDQKNDFTHFASTVFPIISALVVFDILQLILAGALRGAANVKVVMLTRLIVGTCIFIPLAYGLSLLPIDNLMIKFILIYGSFYIANGLMSLVYLLWFRRDIWKRRPDVHF
ncbi:MAG: MATE family efflux transporter [Candidatus Babeliaceae bacterium]|nr:MATE family efflux transporter [Candidatus Babeliaceae bacterium]